MSVSRALPLLTFALLLTGPASAYQLKATDDGKSIVWEVDSTIDVVIDATTRPKELDAAAAEAAVRAAMTAWVDAGLPLTITVRTADEPQPLDAKDGVTVVRWDQTEWTRGEKRAVVMSVHGAVTGLRRAGADILLDGVNATWTASSAYGGSLTDLQAVLLHEAGHLFGLAHSDERLAVMFFETSSIDPQRHALHADDLAAVAKLVSEMYRRRDEISASQQQDVESEDIEAPAADPPSKIEKILGCGVQAEPPPRSAWLVLAVVLALAVVARRHRA